MTEAYGVMYGFNMENDADDRREFGIDEGAVGFCWNERRIVVCDMVEARTSFADRWRMSKYQQSLVRPTLRSLVSVPIFHQPVNDRAVAARRLAGVLSFDSDDIPVEVWFEASAQGALVKCAKPVGEHLTEEVP